MYIRTKTKGWGIGSMKPKKLYAVADGEFIHIEDVADLAFAQKMIGEGYAIIPEIGEIYAPIQGEVTHVFPTQHALVITSDHIEILLHMGINTVSLKGKPFETVVKKGDQVTDDTLLSTVDLAYLKEMDRAQDMVVVITTTNESIDHIDLVEPGSIKRGDVVGKIQLRE